MARCVTPGHPVGPKSKFLSAISCTTRGLSFEARYPGLDQMMVHWAEGMSPKEFKEQLVWFARDVIPAFTRRA